MVLEVTFDLAGGDVERDGGSGVEIVAGTLVAHPRAAVADAPVRQIGLGIVVPGDPHRAAAGLPLIALRPGLAAGFAGRGNGVGSPQLLAGVGIEGRDEAANSKLAARRADHHFAAGNQRRQRDVVAGFVVRDRRRSRLPGRFSHRAPPGPLRRRHIDFVPVERDSAVGVVRHGRARGPGALYRHRRLPVLGVDGDHLIVGRGDEHDAVIDDRRGFVHFRFAGREHPDRPQPRDIVGRDLGQRAVAPAVVRAPYHQPVAIFRRLEALGGYRLVIAEHCRKRRYWCGRLLAKGNRYQRESAGNNCCAKAPNHDFFSLVRHHTPMWVTR